MTTWSGRAPYSPSSWCGLVRGVGDQPVGLGRDLVLADQPGQRLGRVAVGEGGVLHLGQGVRGVHQRHPPAGPGEPADLAGEPVVRVHQVVPARLVLGLDPQHPAVKAHSCAGQVLLGQPLVRPGDHVPDEHARARPRPTGGSAAEVARVNISTSTPISASRRDELDDVDVHAARVAGAGLVAAARCAPTGWRPAGGGTARRGRPHGPPAQPPPQFRATSGSRKSGGPRKSQQLNCPKSARRIPRESRVTRYGDAAGPAHRGRDPRGLSYPARTVPAWR